MYNIAFIIEQALGHRTHGQNLQSLVPTDPEIQAHWILPEWQTNGLVSKLPVLKSNWTLQAGLQARKMVGNLSRAVKLDGLFFHTQVTAVLSPNWLSHYPAVVSLDATPSQYDSLGDYYKHDTGPEWFENLKWRITRNAFQKAAHLVTWSEWARQGLADYDTDPAKATVIPPGVDTAVWTRPTTRKPDNNSVKILFVGGNLERKGGLLLLNVCRSLRQLEGIPEIELHLVTKDSVTAEPGLCIYNNMKPNSAELRQLYFEADIFCLPTYGDCLPMVISEAGAAGLPTISTRVAAIPEIVLEGETGYLIDQGDEAGLAESLKRLISDPKLRLRQGSAAETQIKKNFDAAQNANRLLRLLKQTVQQQ